MEKKTDTLLTVKEVARKLCVDDTTARRWIGNGKLEGVLLPHRSTRQSYRIRQSVLDELLRLPSEMQH